MLDDAALWARSCVGKMLWAVMREYDNARACARLQECNWADCAALGATSAKHCRVLCEQGQGLPVSKLSNLPGFCQYCDGDQCWPVTTRPRCLVPGPRTHEECTAVRGRWLPKERMCQ